MFMDSPKVENFVHNVLKSEEGMLKGQVMRKRSFIMAGIREFFAREDFLEVETPLLVRLPGMEPYLDPFKTEFIGVDESREDMYLITSPEYAMKKLLVAGYEKIFTLCKTFRNKETGGDLHNPEFTMLEFYRITPDYSDVMEDTERLVQFLAEKVHGGTNFIFGGKNIDVGGPWQRKKVAELFEEYAGISREIFEDVEKLRGAALKKGYSIHEQSSYEDVFFSLFLNEIEPKLGIEKPLIVYEYPVQMAALAQKCPHDSRYAQRFEVYIAGMELCNAFGELTDAVEQKKRLVAEREERKNLGKDVYDVDQSFIAALEFGMPPSSGNALGVDRLVMLLTDSARIEDVLFFPHKDL